MSQQTVRRRLGEIAHARSGDKGGSANVGVIAYTTAGYELLRERLSAETVADYFRPMGLRGVDRYELPNLGALNFVLHGILGSGGSRSLRTDAQGKALGQVLLEMPIDIPTDRWPACVPPVEEGA